jgi:probable rRNA maturation factor
MKIDLALQNTTRRKIPRATEFKTWIRAALPGARRSPVWVGVRVVGETESERLNFRYRKQKKPTNVLSFPFVPPPGLASGTLGDVVLCASVIAREAKAQGKTLRAHWAHLTVHGVLHLQGYDHIKSSDAKRMESKEIRILKNLGFKNPYT